MQQLKIENINFTKMLGNELINLNNVIKSQKLLINEYKLKAAIYKAYFYQKINLAEKLQNQLEENYNASVGEFDGFCYAS